MPREAIKRLFCAILLPEPVQASLASIQQELKKAGADVKWVEPRNTHITLKFLGDTAESKTPLIRDALKKALASQRSFSLTLDEHGAFPSIDAPKIIWTGSRQETPQALSLAAKIDEALAPLGFKKDAKPFTVHATLGRVRSSQNRVALIEKINQLQPLIKPQTLKVGPIALMESQLASAGPAYTLLEKFELT